VFGAGEDFLQGGFAVAGGGAGVLGVNGILLMVFLRRSAGGIAR
jgi:hypothetical protein